jgi:CheY-like chemotaxis protein
MTILIADDDEDDLEFFIEAIREIDGGMLCVSARNGIEAIKLIDYGEVVPDYIFLDLNMPKMDGKQCLKYLKSSPLFQHIPVIIYSTSGRKEDIDEAILNAASAFIVKPNKFTLLKQEILTVLANIRPPK